MTATTRWNLIKDIIGSLAFIIAGGVFLREMNDLPPTVTRYPSAIIYLVFALCLALIAKSVAHLIARRQADGTPAPAPAGGAPEAAETAGSAGAAGTAGTAGAEEKFGFPTVFVLVGSLLYVWSLPYLGFTVSTAIMMVAFMLTLGVRSILALILVPLVEIVFLLYVFEKLLTVFLPDAGWLRSVLGMA